MTLMKNKTLKKLLCGVLAAATVLSATAGAFAATSDVIDNSKKASLTIYKYDEVAAKAAGVNLSNFIATGERNTDAERILNRFAIRNVGFTYYKVGNINQESVSGKLVIKYDIPTDFEKILGLTKADHKYTSDELNSAMRKAMEQNTETKNKLEAYITKGTKMPATDATGMTKAENLPLGLYLAVETSVPEDVNTTVNPFLVSLPMTDSTGDYWNYNVFVYPKNQTNLPDIDKLVSENGTYADIATASTGDVLSYRVVSKLPTITSKATYLDKYEFVDHLAEGMTYTKDAKVYIYNNANDARNATGTPVASWNIDSGKYTAAYDGNQMTVAVAENGFAELNPAYSDMYMVVAYTAKLNGTADTILGDAGNINTIDLTYSRTTTDEETIEDEARVYTFGIDLTKNFSDDNGDATKVKFVLKNVTDGYFVTAEGSNGLYYVNDGVKAAEEKDATVFSPSADGKMIIKGLEADQYEIVETHTDAGYVLMRDPIIVTFTATVDEITPSAAAMTGHDNPNAKIIVVNGARAFVTVDGSDAEMIPDGTSTNAFVKMSVMNNSGFDLPYTGSAAMKYLPLAGSIIALCGAALCLASKKRKDEDEKH